MKKLFFLLSINLLIISCARVGSPNGGTKDTLAPKFLGSNIDTTRVNVSKNLRELRLNFDEFVNLKEVNKQLIISPPIKKIKKILPSNLASKYVLIQWEDSLKTNTTYNFNFGNAIVDNNEGNVLPYFNFAFSTGEKLDSLYVAGTVSDALLPKKKATESKEKSVVVGLYKAEEKTDFKQKPYYITKVDEENYFELNYIQKGEYYIIGFEDENQNSVYDAGKEKVAFLKDKLVVDKGISGLKLKLFPSKKSPKFVESKQVFGGVLMLFEGKPEKLEVKSVTDQLQDYKVTHTPKSDSLYVWFNADKNNFAKTGITPLKFSYQIDTLKKETLVSYKINAKEEFSLSNTKGNLLAPKEKFKIEANLPIETINTEKWKLESDSVSQNFTAKISEKNPYEVLIDSDFKIGKKYILTIPKETVSSFYENNKKTFQFQFEGDKPENYGSVTFKLKNKPNSKFWVQLLDEKSEVLYSQYTNKTEIKFDNLKPATYFARILVDNNVNGTWDEADFAAQSQAEDAYVFGKEINARPMWEIVEDWELK